MFGFIIGTACLFGLVKMARHGRCGGYGYAGHGGGCGEGGHGWHGGHHHHHGHGEGHGGHGRGGWGGRHGGFGGAPWFARGGGPDRMALRWLFERLETTPGQEKVIQEAIDEVRQAARSARGEFKASREDLGRAVSGESFDETVMGGAFARQDETLRTIRGAVTGALGKVHGALDENQRKRLADLLSDGPAAFRQWGGAPYRM